MVAALAVASSVFLGSCGGGGASTGNSADLSGPLAILPAAATLYAGVPYSFQIAGGRAPFLLSSSEPVLLPVPATINGTSFQVVAANPSVVDVGIQPGELPVRSVQITVRDAFGQVFVTGSGANGIQVAQNFLTGYGVVFTSNCNTGQACSGSDTIVRLVATTNGVLYGNRAVRFCVVRGNYKFVVPEIPSNLPASQVDCYNTVTDHTGVAIARIRVPTDATTQLATLRVIDVATGAFADELFTITQGNIVGQLTVIPNSFTFTGFRQGVCGTGSGDFVVFDGDPPYTAVTSDPNITVTPTTNNSNPARFTVTAFNPNVCLSNATVVITDRNQRRATVTVTTEEGSAQLPPLAVAPTTISLNDTCGFSASVTAVGGLGPLSANSTHPRVSATVSGNLVTITRLTPDPASPPGAPFYPTTATVVVTDGATVQPVTVNNVRAFCP
jgi:hypothetical protein